MNLAFKLIALLSLLKLGLAAQNELPIPRNLKPSFEKKTRNLNGQPGENYWQNFAKYQLNINFTPASRLVSGTVEIDYQNNSADTLNSIHFKLYPNFYQKGAIRASPIRPEDTNEGMVIQKITANGEVQDVGTASIDGTEMSLPIQPLLSKGQIHFSIDFSYGLNRTSHNRTGEIEPGAYFIAYFFPRIAVYDDVDGWNTNPYTGTQEFYNDFCDFKADITVPRGFVVWATGNFENCDEVLNPNCCHRLKQAESSEEFIYILDSANLELGDATRALPTNTFKFEAENVTDFVFATSNHYLWRSTSLVVDQKTLRRTRVDAVFNPNHKDYFRVLGDAVKTVEIMSFRFPKWPFPYPHETIFDGLDQMEYPMMVNDNPVEDVAQSIELTDHEIFHTMFPFFTGINETKYGWMDEGWATLAEWLISPMIDSTVEDIYGVESYEKEAGTERDLPIINLSTQLSGTSFFNNSYPKPAMGYLFVKDMLGDELFTQALHHYIRTWQGKHPLPLDFFHCMNQGSGKNLNWFWRAWFFENGVPDLAIEQVSKKQVTIERKGSKPVPIDLMVEYMDGSMESLHRSIAVWENGDKMVDIPFTYKMEVVKIKLGSAHVPDIDKHDNLWEKDQK